MMEAIKEGIAPQEPHQIFLSTLQLGFLLKAGVEIVGQPTKHSDSLIIVVLKKDCLTDAHEDTVMRALWKVIDHARTKIELQ